MERRAWLTFLSSNNYYLYLLLGLYKDLLDTGTIYPVYCGITPEVDIATRNILTKVGIKLIELDTSIFSNKILKNSQKSCAHYAAAFTKLALLDTKIEALFDKVVYIDTDMQVLHNIDDLFEKPHMSAVEDLAPSKNHYKYTLGCSIFCSGLFVWDFKNNLGKGHEILNKLNTLDMKIIWHDQNVLNYFYNNWLEQESLHLNPIYSLMNTASNFKIISEADIKAIHYTTRIREGWPFNQITKVREKYWKDVPHLISWINHLSSIVLYFNKQYNLNIPIIKTTNLKLYTQEQEHMERAYGKPNTYLYF